MFKTSNFRDGLRTIFSQLQSRIYLPRPQSLAITFFPGGGAGVVFELINKESGGEGSDGKGEKKSDTWSRKLSSFSPFISHHPPLALCAHSHHPMLAHLARLQHPALKVCARHYALGELGWGKESTATTNAKTLEIKLKFITISNVLSGYLFARYT